MEQKMIIVPKDNCSPVEVLECYCLTSDSKSSDGNNSSLQHIMIFGKCFYGCFVTDSLYQVQLVDKGVTVYVVNSIVKAYSVVSVRTNMACCLLFQSQVC